MCLDPNGLLRRGEHTQAVAKNTPPSAAPLAVDAPLSYTPMWDSTRTMGPRPTYRGPTCIQWVSEFLLLD